MLNRGRSLTSIPAIDLLVSPAARSYFEAREQQTFYMALKTVDARRNHHAKLIEFCDTFLEQTADKHNQLLVDDLITRAAPREPVPHVVRLQMSKTKYTTAAVELQRRHSHGYALLAVTQPLTIESLKAKYRVAAAKYHPDHGGSHNDMISINEAYAVGHFLLLEEQLHENSAGGADQIEDRIASPLDCNNYRRVIRLLIFSVHLDDWALDKASTELDAIISDISPATSITRSPSFLMELAQNTAKLESRLTLTCPPLNHEANIAEEAQKKLASESLSYGSFSAPPWVARRSGSPKVVLNHVRQAENALRLGIIDQKRYENLARKFAGVSNAKEARRKSEDAIVRDYMNIMGFLRLPTDVAAADTRWDQCLIPEPSYYQTRIAELSKDQQSEYKMAFSGLGSLELVRKYKYVRLQSLLETTILYDSDITFEDLEREALLLGQFSGGSIEYYATAVADAVQFLENLPQEKRAERLALLRQLNGDNDSRHLRTTDPHFVFTSEGAVCSVRLLPQYFELLRGPLRSLRRLVKDQKGLPSTDT